MKMKNFRVNAKYATVPFIPVVMVKKKWWLGLDTRLMDYSHLFESVY